MKPIKLEYASISKHKIHKGIYVLRWADYLEIPDTGFTSFNSVVEAKEQYYTQVAEHHLGSAIRDNTHAQKIQFGKWIDKYGVTDSGDMITPKDIEDAKSVLIKERKNLRDMIRQKHPNEIELEAQQHRITEAKKALVKLGFNGWRDSKYE